MIKYGVFPINVLQKILYFKNFHLILNPNITKFNVEHYAIKTNNIRYHLLLNSTTLEHSNPKYEYLAVRK